MGVSTQDIFGDAAGSEPATPGSYGESPPGFRLPNGTRLGLVSLQVADLPRSVAYYERTLGMRVLDREPERAVLSAQYDDRSLVELRERAGVRPVPRGKLGLYHFAILLPDRASLGRFMLHLRDIGSSVGAADHLVSESLYLQDPDNLGIEVYADRPRHTWRRIGRELMMATDPLDREGLINAAAGVQWSGMPAGTVMGHIHLHVGNLAQASAFYSDALGFDRTVWEYPGALFLAADGYHHHLGTNTWAGSGATPAAADEARLLEWSITLPDTRSLAAARESLQSSGYSVDTVDLRDGSSVRTRDPWGTVVRLEPSCRSTTQ